MAAQWYSFTDEERGPVAFSELAAMVADGRLREADLVRRAESSEWQRVDAVPGLMRAASQPARPRTAPSAKSKPAPLTASPVPARPAGPGWKEWWTGPRLAAGVGVLCMLFAVGLLVRYILSRPERFPETRTVTIERETPALLDQMRAPPPKRPTLPDLPQGVPITVPGFENIPWLKSPTLSDDLKTIVYVTYRGEKTLDDLMMATRAETSLPFIEHRAIEATVTGSRESHPTLSPNGLELIYAIAGTPSTLFRVRRADAASEFTGPERVQIEGDPFDGLHHDAPQFIDPLTLVFTTYDADYKQRSLVLAKRTSPTTGFAYVDTLPVADPWPRYAFSRRLTRAYYPKDKGIFLTARHPGTKEFVSPELLVTADITGPDLSIFDDTIWLSPAEDVVFYCSPGSDPARAKDHRLWMLRF